MPRLVHSLVTVYISLWCIGPIAFCDIVGTEEEDEDESLKGSKKNVDEAGKAVSCRLGGHYHILLSVNQAIPIHYCRWSWLRSLAH